MSARRTKLSTMFEHQTALTPVKTSNTPGSPLTPGWVHGKLAVFATPPSAKLSPKGPRTRRSSVYARRQTMVGPLKDVSGKTTKTTFKIPASKIKSPPGVKTRSRRVSMHVVHSTKPMIPQISLSVQEMAELVRSTSSESIPTIKVKKIEKVNEPLKKSRGKTPVKRQTNKAKKPSAKKTPVAKSQTNAVKKQSENKSNAKVKGGSKKTVTKLLSSGKTKSAKKSTKKKESIVEESEDVLLTLSQLNDDLLDECPVASKSGKKPSSKSKQKVSEKKKSTKKATKTKSENKVNTPKLVPDDETTSANNSLGMSESLHLPSRMASPIFTPVKNLLARFAEYRSSSASPKVATPNSSSKTSVKSSTTPETWGTPLSSGKKSATMSQTVDPCSDAFFRTPVGTRTPLGSTPTMFTNIKPMTLTNNSLSTPDTGLRKRKTALTPFYESLAAKRRRIGDGQDSVSSPLSVSRTSLRDGSFLSEFGDENESLMSMNDEDFNKSNVNSVSPVKPQSWCSLM